MAVAALTYFTVVGNYLAALGQDLWDPASPEPEPMTGTLVFTPLVDSGNTIQAPTLTPPSNLALRPIQAILRNGEVTRNNVVGCRLPANTDVLNLTGDLYYHVEFYDVRARSERITINAFDFLAETTDTLLDLVGVTPVAGTGANGSIIGPPGPPGPPGDGTYNPPVLFSAATAVLGASAQDRALVARTLNQARMRASTPPIGSTLSVQVQTSTDGTTWTNIGVVTIPAGGTVEAVAPLSHVQAVGELTRVNATSVGSGTPATGVAVELLWTA